MILNVGTIFFSDENHATDVCTYDIGTFKLENFKQVCFFF